MNDPLPRAFRISLGVVLRDEDDPDVVTRTLGVTPAQAWRIGDPRVGRRSGEILGHRTDVCWRMVLVADDLAGDPWDLVNSHLRQMLGSVLPRWDALLAALPHVTTVVDVIATFFRWGEDDGWRWEIAPDVLSGLTRLGASLAFTIEQFDPDGSPDRR